MATPFDNVFMDPFPLAQGGAPTFVPQMGIPPMGVPQAPPMMPNAAPADPTAGVVPMAPPLPQTPPGVMFSQEEPGALPSGLPSQLQPPPVEPQTLAYRRAMQSIESGGRYDIITDAGRGRRAIGAYQIMEENIPEWTRRWLGRAMTPEEFRRSPEAQDAVFDAQFGDYIRQFGSPQKAAEAWMSPVAAAGGRVGPDRFGTTAQAHGRNFISSLSRVGVSQQQGAASTSVEMSPDISTALGLPSVSMLAAPAVSPRAAAIAPGFAAAQAAPSPPLGAPGVGPQGPNAPLGSGTGGLPFGDLWQAAGAQPSGLTQVASFLAQRPAAVQVAAGRIIQRGQELQQQYSNATPQQIAQLLVRDPIFGQNALMLGSDGPAILQAAAAPAIPQQIITGQSGTQFFSNQGGVISPTGMGVPPTPPADVQLIEYLQRLPEDQRQRVIDMMGQLRQARSLPSDREQAWQRLQAADPATYTNEMRDRWLAGLIRPEPVMNEFGQIVGQRWVDTVTNQPVTGPSSRQTGVTPPPTVAPGAGVAAPGTVPVTPPAGAAPGQPAPTTQPNQPTTQRYKIGDRDVDVTDIPSLSLQTSMLDRPSDVASSMGPMGAATGLIGGLVGNVPGFEATGEETNRRRALLQNIRAAYATYQQGRQLAGEHTETMAEIPGATEWIRNPVQGLGMLITARERIVRHMQLYRDQMRDPDLAKETKVEASKLYARAQAVLQTMPTISEMLEARNNLITGAVSPRAADEDVGRLMERAFGAAGRVQREVTGEEEPAPSGRDFQKLTDERLRDLYKRSGTTPEQKRAIEIEAERRRSERARTKTGE